MEQFNFFFIFVHVKYFCEWHVQIRPGTYNLGRYIHRLIELKEILALHHYEKRHTFSSFTS